MKSIIFITCLLFIGIFTHMIIQNAKIKRARCSKDVYVVGIKKGGHWTAYPAIGIVDSSNTCVEYIGGEGNDEEECGDSTRILRY